MKFLTKEKSKQKRKGVNNQNNSIELFPIINTQITSLLLFLNFN
jgi:hypothetical protein